MKRTLNYELLEFHVREAAEELDSLLRRIRFMLGEPDENGELEADARGALTEYGLEASLAHAYHHMNTAWNARSKASGEADRHFDSNEKFPRPTEHFDLFARYWPKSLLKKRKRK